MPTTHQIEACGNGNGVVVVMVVGESTKTLFGAQEIDCTAQQSTRSQIGSVEFQVVFQQGDIFAVVKMGG